MKGKKITAILLSTALTFALVTGCGAKPQTPAAPSADAEAPSASTEGTDEASTDTQQEAPADNTAESSDKTIGLLVPATVGDPFIALYLMWGDLSEIALRLAPEYPDTDFVLCDVDMQTNEPNVSSVSVDPTEAAFIAGVVAANNTTAKKVGFIAHADRPVSRKYRDGYINGVHYIDPSIEVAVAYVGDDQDPVKGQEVAKLMIQNEGVDLIFQSASQSGLGVIAGCEEMGIKCIGSDDYQGDVSDCVIWSALKPIDEALYMEGDASFKGTFESGDKVYGLSYGLALYTDVEFNQLSAELQETVAQVVADINSGEIDVTAGMTE